MEQTAPATLSALPQPSLTQEARMRVLLEGPIFSTLVRLAAPNVLNLIALAVLVTADGVYVSWLGSEALAGVALVFPWKMLMQHMAAGGMGGAIAAAIARALGARNPGRARDLAVHALVIAGALALLQLVL